jgi:hypothetical protein
MSLLDDNPLNWDNADLQKLLGAFIEAYPDSEAAKILAKAAGIEPGTFPIREDMLKTWTALIDAMARQGKLRTLVEKAAEDDQVAGWRAVFEGLLALPGDPVELGYEKPCQALFLYQGRPFINRSDFRDYLTQLNEPSGKRFLVVNGPPDSGKTYSYYLVETLKKPWSFKCAFIELKEGEQARFSAKQLASRISDRLELPATRSMPDQQSVGDRWAEELGEWLLDKIQREPKPCWIVLDGFGHEDLPAATAQLVYYLIDAIDKWLPNVRLLLFDYPLTFLPRTLRPPIVPVDELQEDDIGEGMVEAFFWQAFAHKQVDHDETLVKTSAAKVLNDLPGDREEHMFEITRRIMMIMAEYPSP